jgi:methylenetetrahydrofolate dehydrogenase (NADP+)/methenyltetrahydrofolate cyclohydrolase
MNRDPRLLYGADIRKRILDEVAADIARLATRRKVGRLVSVGIGEVEEIAVYIRGQARAAAAVIDIGINQVTDADGNSRIVGDADTGAVADIASWTTPVPGGVGPGTVAILIRNAAIAFEKQIQLGWV